MEDNPVSGPRLYSKWASPALHHTAGVYTSNFAGAHPSNPIGVAAMQDMDSELQAATFSPALDTAQVSWPAFSSAG